MMQKQSILQITHSTGTYPIQIGHDLLSNIRTHITGKQVFIITDENIAPHYLPLLQSYLCAFTCDILILPSGEKTKTLNTFSTIMDYCAAHHHHRDITFIALGGGVISDLTGFAAACYQRGVPWIALPTTLLAQVDASVGGKTAVNHPMGKNLIGAFYPPKAVLIDINLLSTLPNREFQAGVAEIIKAALIADATFFTWLETNMVYLIARHKDTLLYAIQRAIEIKQQIVIEDEKEKHIRMILNFGHTFGHAIEKKMHFETWLHGEAIAYGMLVASLLSHQKKQLDDSQFKRIYTLLTQFNFIKPIPPHITTTDLINAMQSDKKIKSGSLTLILLKAIGVANITNDIPATETTFAWNMAAELAK